jgi:hypothetical protein
MDTLKEIRAYVQDAETLKKIKDAPSKKHGFFSNEGRTLFAINVSFSDANFAYTTVESPIKNSHEITESLKDFVVSHEDEIIEWIAYDLLRKAAKITRAAQAELAEGQEELRATEEKINEVVFGSVWNEKL